MIDCEIKRRTYEAAKKALDMFFAEREEPLFNPNDPEPEEFDFLNVATEAISDMQLKLMENGIYEKVHNG